MSEEAQDALLAGLATDVASVDMTHQDRAMLGYAVKLTRTPGRMVERDVALLREHGFDDRGIHDICSIVAYFAFVNRIADGLGVELEDDNDER
jgi:uncharacterized peroxidase-related enzyme